MTNQEFETELHLVAQKNLNSEIDVDVYVKTVLDEMWDGDSYRDADGDTCHEIRGHMTKSGNPVTI